jgi:hypothetical protein
MSRRIEKARGVGAPPGQHHNPFQEDSMQAENTTPAGNRYWRREGGKIEMELTQGKTCILDESDLGKICYLKWRASKNHERFYAKTHAYGRDRKRRELGMHTLLLGNPWPGKGAHVDHHDGNTLNNCRSNLRATGAAGNAANKKRPSSNTTGFKGVSVNPKCTIRPFRALVQKGGKKVYSAQFATAEEAAEAYDRESRVHFGEFARPNK